MESWWDDLGKPRLTPELRDAAVRGVDRELEGFDLEAIVDRRDEILIELLRARAAARELP